MKKAIRLLTLIASVFASTVLSDDYVAIPTNLLATAQLNVVHQYLATQSYEPVTNVGMRVLIMRKPSASRSFMIMDFSSVTSDSSTIDTTICDAETAQLLAFRTLTAQSFAPSLLDQLIAEAQSNNCGDCAHRSVIGWGGMKHLSEDNRRRSRAVLARLVIDKQIALTQRSDLQDIIALQDTLSDRIGVPKPGHILASRNIVMFRNGGANSLNITVYDTVNGVPLIAEHIVGEINTEKLLKQLKATSEPQQSGGAYFLPEAVKKSAHP